MHFPFGPTPARSSSLAKAAVQPQFLLQQPSYVDWVGRASGGSCSELLAYFFPLLTIYPLGNLAQSFLAGQALAGLEPI